MKIPRGGGTPTTLASCQSDAWAFAVDSTNVYWSDAAVGLVMRAAK
jgi:hypothetical protein